MRRSQEKMTCQRYREDERREKKRKGRIKQQGEEESGKGDVRGEKERKEIKKRREKGGN